MIAVATLMMATCYYNFGTTTSTTSTATTTGTANPASYATSSTFIALYLLFFSTMICCYEIGWSTIASQLVQNFGFLYFPISRFIFLVLVSAFVIFSNIYVITYAMFIIIYLLIYLHMFRVMIGLDLVVLAFDVW